MKQIYLDNHATTPVDPRVLDAMLPFLRGEFGNPSSKTHPYGWKAQEAVESARKRVATLLGAAAKEIVFTAGATESNNLSILGASEVAVGGWGVGAASIGSRDHIVTQATEHHAVLDPVHELERRGFRVTVLRPQPDGVIDLNRLRDAIDERTLLVSIMAANNEIGAIQPLAEIGALCGEAGALFHTDAAQAAGKIAIDVQAASIDLLSISGHKFYAPKGVGALYVRRRGRRVRVRPAAWGGGQEGGLRPGTLNVPGIAALGEASRLGVEELDEEAHRIGKLRDRLLAGLREAVPDLRVNGPEDAAHRLPGNLSVSFPRVDGAALLVNLHDIAASAGSACAAGNAEPSYVLASLGVPDELAISTLRLGLGRFTTAEEIDYAIGRVAETVAKLRR